METKERLGRILHEPFFPLNSLPPSQPPLPPLIFPSSTSSNPNPKQPFSTTTPYQSSPFFPFYTYPFPPPPPPTSFSTFASFPANISSLLIPHSFQPKESSSGRNLSLAITAVACTTVMVAISVFLYLRRRHYINKTLANSETETTNINQRLSHISEFLYLGNTINSHRVEAVTDSGTVDSRKMESPELQPIPRLSLRHHEEFLSPKISSFCASESSSVNGLELLRTRSFPSTSMLSSPEQNQVLSTSSERENVASSERTLPRVSNDSNGATRESFAPVSSSGFSLPSSSEKAMHCDILDQSPTMSSFSGRYRLSCASSLPLSPTLVPSPERELSHVWNESEKFANCVSLRKQHWGFQFS
ncbi:unnamed protein product [Lupinus luteus]|uniref:Uncharacterized protein n=1 Tax=Lupinus luteus TaxID=3873 RepID=A0AAV1Y3D9_LUPLU